MPASVETAATLGLVVLAAVAVAAVLHGTVTIGPLTPVCRVGTPCDGPAKRATLTFSHAGRSVTVRTDAAGRYRVTLAPGSWRVRANVGMSIEPRSVAVRAGTHRTNFAIDTGIR
jgi:hypothetical protein